MIIILAIAAVVAAGVAISKHVSLASLKTAAKAELQKIDALGVKLEGEAKSELAAIVARIRALI